jgi:hypothetical protein
MDSVLNSVIVTGVLFVMNAAVGGYLDRFGKPSDGRFDHCEHDISDYKDLNDW